MIADSFTTEQVNLSKYHLLILLLLLLQLPNLLENATKGLAYKVFLPVGTQIRAQLTSRNQNQ